MLAFLTQFAAAPKASIVFLYHDSTDQPAPSQYSDLLELLGDIRMLHLSTTQKDELRAALRKDLATGDEKEIWRHRALRKNLIHSLGRIV
ncbi:hypothetical protein [Halodesulfovibrio spirochaetisodalis]|uniref:Uncharacterized protein n=1 Tax=Halodesulfovibrio spirochaetisodalis TaxID=1560234 RepID=A0A1B7XCG1_9BACT|nr:hypothetical protein [Halodesulfovibrio spirochaetisodalis]OBQ51570.1 hypothetical protein SP90_09310 [Halodesulfovibrio spirochaetisodalis]